LLTTGDKIGLINSYNFLGNAQNSLGNHRGAWESFQRCQTLSYECGSRSDEVVSVLNLAITGFELGRLSEAKSYAEEAERLSGRYQVKYTLGYAMALGALLEVMLGDGQRAFERSYLALALVREISNKYVEALVLSYQLELMLALGQWEDATRAAQFLREVIDATGNLEPEARLNIMLAELHLEKQEWPEAEWRAGLALQAAEVSHAKGVVARACRVQAQLSLAQEKFSDAEIQARKALRHATEIGQGLERARSLKVLGELSLAQGTGSAAQHFEMMLDQAERMQHALLLAQARFGTAAAMPYARDAADLAAKAREGVETFQKTLPANLRAAFSQMSNHARILKADYIEASLPRRNPSRRATLLNWLH
jgi:tetratricopeptide (TPR) repeat protein